MSVGGGEEEEDPPYPLEKLLKLEELINNPRWVIPVLPKGELEVLLEASIRLAKKGKDVECEDCLRFYRDGLPVSFVKILTDEAVSSWKPDIQKYILLNCERLMELLVLKWTHALGAEEEELFASKDLLVLLLNPHHKFHVQHLKSIFFLFFTHIPSYLESLKDEELKKEGKNDALSSLIKALKHLSTAALTGEENEERIRELEMFRLQMILRQLRVSSFGGKMNALNEVNRVIASVSYYHQNPQRRSGLDVPIHHPQHNNNVIVGKPGTEEDFLTAERMARWLCENKVLQIVLQDSLHQPQYVEKLEKIIRFKIREFSLSSHDLDDIWDAQVGQHEAIVKNVHDLLAKLAWDFSPVQLDHLFKRFQSSLSEANDKQREKLLELIRRLAEDDKDGVMADKVLNLFWTLSHSKNVSTEIMDQALAAHVKILDYSCTQNSEGQKNRCLKKQIREICSLYPESSNNDPHNTLPNPHHHAQGVAYRHDVINRLQSSHVLVIKVANNLTSYIKQLEYEGFVDKDPLKIFPDGRFDHIVQMDDYGFVLLKQNKYGSVWRRKQCFKEDREACFDWFSKLMGVEPDLDPEISKSFFVENILKFDPMLMTESGIQCFDKFFKSVNSKEEKLIIKRRIYLMNNLELIGIDYIWQIIRSSPDEEVANRAIDILEETFTNLGPSLIDSQLEIHEDFISTCMEQLRPIYDTISIMDPGARDTEMKYRQLIRILKVLYEYIFECDSDFGEERSYVPLYRAAKGKQLSLIIRFTHQGRQNEDVDILVHTNDTLGSLRRQIFQRLKLSSASIKLELFYNGECLENRDDGKILLNTQLTDKSIVTGKVSQISSNIASSPDSSSDSSTSSPHHLYDGPNYEAEQSLPGIIMAKSPRNKRFLIQLADLGCERNIPDLRDRARHVLQIMPPDFDTVNSMRKFCHEIAATQTSGDNVLFKEFFSSSPSETLYNLEVMYALLMPGLGTLTDKTLEFQLNFVKAGGMQCFKSILTQRDFLSNADDVMKQLCYISVAKISADGIISDSPSPSSPAITMVLQKALIQVPNPTNEFRLRQISHRIAPQLAKYMTVNIMDYSTVLAIIRLAWASSSGNINLISSDSPYIDVELHAPHEEGNVYSLMPEQISLCKEAMEILTLAIALYPPSLDKLNKEKMWHQFIIDMILLSNLKRVRIEAGEQFLTITNRCSNDENSPKILIDLLFSVLNTTATQKAKQSSEYFVVLSCLLLNVSSTVRDDVRETGHSRVDDSLLEGHLRITRELIAFLSPEKKIEVGNTVGLIKDIIEDFIFPSSKMMVIYNQTGGIPMDNVVPVCTTGQTHMAAFEVYDESLYEWEYLPPVGPRPLKGFVGLKNAGATCYMNSVLQQLFMIEGVRNGVLSAEGACNDPDEDFSGEDRENEAHSNEHNHNIDIGEYGAVSSRKDYNITILKQVQAIFAHLSHTKLQFYVPKGLWKHFRMQGEPVNLREQQDAVEFFMSLIDFVDEALKALGYEQRMTKVLGGVLSDQMICKTCPHRYSREEPFCVLSVEVRNHNNLTDSLHEYVKGELLDGNNAYHCASCDKKVDTMKRLCIKKLPPILVIQLKRFDYDYERECAIKFNDYFEFPRVLDMEPYTVGGLAKIEGEVIDADPSDLDGKTVHTYKLRGMVVHSGQASGGHYYSYIKSKDKWYKFDDGEVSEVKVDDDEELKAQCYGGECVSEVYDQMSKRTSSRRQKRWWNAYMLFYCRSDIADDSLAVDVLNKMNELNLNGVSVHSSSSSSTKIPVPIEKSIQKQNVRFLHHRNQFNNEYFKFMKQLICCNRHVVNPVGDRHSINTMGNSHKWASDFEEIALTTVQLASKFLFQSAFHTKKSLRGSALDWYDSLHDYLNCSPIVRSWFGQKALFAHPVRFCEYMLECPSVEVRTAFSRIIVCLAHFSLNDGPVPAPPILQQPFIPIEIVGNTLADHLLSTVLSLLWMEVSEHGRHITQYFSFFSMYASLGVPEKTQLLKLNVPAIFIQVAIDEGPGPPIKYQYVEFGKLYQVVSTLIRCCDVSNRCSSQKVDGNPLPNPYAETSEPIMPIQQKVAELVFVKCEYLKKLVEEANSQEDTKKFLADITDSNALKGIHHENTSRDGLFDNITKSTTHCHKRAYHCIKLLVSLFSNCRVAKMIFDNSPDIRNTWSSAVVWLTEELDRGRSVPGSYPPGQYSYSNWSPPGQSNENTNGYFLERSHSAKLTLDAAFQLLSEEDMEEIEEIETAEPVNTSTRGGPGGESNSLIESNSGGNNMDVNIRSNTENKKTIWY
ncbi:USP9_24 [Lepeophtheirus salmonis]|uniref:ubiquitinyl hydrolase 1 n=1 Tax=Lepeophtheirus salmonis TaxID=72036 RepID=A0A7R8GZN9_LEPSM|nr:USP9_24 [Lepeophtheirus salmonis]CAF2755783.1 USP9_24 [Lepeophtheirus salmonis]